MQTFSMLLSYNGEKFCGFARQPSQRTVQGCVENALSLLFRREVPTVCAGRTDAGVHARGQVVSFDLSYEELRGRSIEGLLRSMNALTDEDISIRDFRQRNYGFSARFDAKWREYRYFICTEDAPAIFSAPFSWHLCGLDIPSMQKASQYLIGEHDFKSFCMAASAKDKPTCRYVSEISFQNCEIMGELQLVIKVVGNAFLHSMVRTIVGTLVSVGRGKRNPDWVAEVLDARDRKAAGETAPAKGLVFWEVGY